MPSKTHPLALSVPSLSCLAEITYNTGMTSRDLVKFFNSFGQKNPSTDMLPSKRRFAEDNWTALNNTTQLAPAVKQLFSDHYWPDSNQRTKHLERLRKAVAIDGCRVSEAEGSGVGVNLYRDYSLEQPKRPAPPPLPSRKPTYSSRAGSNPNTEGFAFSRIVSLFADLYQELHRDGYFDQYLGFFCIDDHYCSGLVKNPENDVLLVTRNEKVWPIDERIVGRYGEEEDLFDAVEYLFRVVSKPLEGIDHQDCGMHWNSFDKQ